VSGHEVVGTVAEVGTAVTHLAVGTRVGLGWYKSACGNCRECMSDDHSICAKSVPTCAGGAKGGFAEAIRVPADYCFPIPASLPSEFAAPLLCGGITVYSPLSKFAPSAASAVGIVGVGGLGAMGIQFAAARGNVVTAMSTTHGYRTLWPPPV